VPADLFVGREAELRASLDLLTAKSSGAAQDIVGLPSVGKSTYLERLRARAQ
jgi:ribosome-interacting GTPase 1